MMRWNGCTADQEDHRLEGLSNRVILAIEVERSNEKEVFSAFLGKDGG